MDSHVVRVGAFVASPLDLHSRVVTSEVATTRSTRLISQGDDVLNVVADVGTGCHWRPCREIFVATSVVEIATFAMRHAPPLALEKARKEI